jgi:hypothetical protein
VSQGKDRRETGSGIFRIKASASSVSATANNLDWQQSEQLSDFFRQQCGASTFQDCASGPYLCFNALFMGA